MKGISFLFSLLHHGVIDTTRKLKIRRRQNSTAITNMESKQWTYLAAHITEIIFFRDLARMNESPNLFKYFTVMVCNDLVCVFITHICTYHPTYRFANCFVVRVFHLVLVYWWSSDYTTEKLNWIQAIDAAASAKLEVPRKLGQNRIFDFFFSGGRYHYIYPAASTAPTPSTMREFPKEIV